MQLCIFQSDNKTAPVWKLYIDGAARNNPGPAGAGVVIIKDDQVIFQEGYSLGSKTNNQAEYLALLLGIWNARKYMGAQDHLIIISDSQLMVMQLNGVYRVKDEHLKKLFAVAQKLLVGVSCKVQHVLREQNKSADTMANKGIDENIPVPEEFKKMFEQHCA